MKSKSFGGLSLILWLFVSPLFAQTTYPANDVATPRSGYYAFINAKIYKDAKTIINSATLIIKQGKIEAVGANLPVPKEAIIIDCKGKSIYPSFIDIYSDYGMSQVQPSMTTYRSPSQMLSNTKGPYSWNQALKTEVLHVKNFSVNDARAKEYRKLGFGSVLSGRHFPRGWIVNYPSQRKRKYGHPKGKSIRPLFFRQGFFHTRLSKFFNG